MSGIRFSKCCKNGAVLLIILFLIGCQPAPSDNQYLNESGETLESPVAISADSVTMTSDYILDVKSSRYQPSLGLQGTIESTKQARFVTAHDVTVQKVLVKQGQWVEEGMPLLIVQRRLSSDEKTITSTEPDNTTAPNPGAEDTATPAADNEENSNEKTVAQSAPKVSETSNETSTNKTSNEIALVDETDALLDAQGDITNEEVSPINSDTDNNQDSLASQTSALPIVIRAGFSGRVDGLYVNAAESVDAGMPLLHLSDDRDLRFIATLPMQAESQLSIGQTVNFTTADLSQKFTGQVSKLVAGDEPDQLQVYVHVIPNEASRNALKPGMIATGRVDYGQIKVGTIVPAQGIHDVDLSVLQKPPYQSLTPLMANVWIIKQDQRLTRQPVEVISYDPSTKQYLVAGISNDSLICLADLPAESAGKKVIVS